jgi:hypothetical protein
MIFPKTFKPLSFLLETLVFSSACLLISCGYHFRADGEPLGVRIESIAIPLIASRSSDIGFEADFTRIIREEFIGHVKVPLVPVESAQAVLIGRIYDIKTEVLTFDIQQETVQGHFTSHEVTNSRRLKIKGDFRLTDRATGKTLWHDGAMEEEARFAVESDPLENRYNRHQALQRVARRLAKRVFLKTVERF